MRCSRCEMPLSPTRSQCPRCGAPTPGKSDGKLNAAIAPSEPTAWQTASATPSSIGKEPPFPLIHTATEQSMLWESNKNMLAQYTEPAAILSTGTGTFPYSPQKKAVFLTPRLGFMISGACIGTGTLLLVLVFIFTRTLLQTSNRANTNQQSLQTPQKAPISTPVLNPTIELSPTPTLTLSGQKYFDGTQLGNTINTTTAQIVTPATTFQLHQKIFVTFQVHTGNQLGAACLLWYWGDNSQSHFEFQLQGSNGAAYSYMPAEAKGAGKVEIYYASTAACTDKILAQSMDFSVKV